MPHANLEDDAGTLNLCCHAWCFLLGIIQYIVYIVRSNGAEKGRGALLVH